MGWLTRTLHQAAAAAEEAIDRARYARLERRGWGRVHLQPYRGHGTARRFYVSARALRGERIPPADARDSAMRNLRHTLRRVVSGEIPGARVRATFGDQAVEAVADGEGYVHLELEPHAELDPDRFWHSVELELLDPPDLDGETARAACHVLVPPPAARFGVISDIDDTVVKTDVTNILRMLRLVLLTNAHTRLPFEGVAAFYRALQAGENGGHTNPIFYVSSSPWNFYDLLTEVFEVHGIPAGPLFLKDYGLDRNMLLSRGHREHKLEAIATILDTHPEIPFVLLGDSGQEDPEIYREAVRSHPGRVRVIYIRNVSRDVRDHRVHHIAQELRGEGVEMVLVPDTVTAARHAQARGLINAAALADIAGDKARDEAAPSPFGSIVS